MCWTCAGESQPQLVDRSIVTADEVRAKEYELGMGRVLAKRQARIERQPLELQRQAANRERRKHAENRSRNEVPKVSQTKSAKAKPTVRSAPKIVMVEPPTMHERFGGWWSRASGFERWILGTAIFWLAPAAFLLSHIIPPLEGVFVFAAAAAITGLTIFWLYIGYHASVSD
jgi:hypothetical protein